jgi:hypothetical protein
MPGLVPGIHVLAASNTKDVDGRDKPGHDEKAIFAARRSGLLSTKLYLRSTAIRRLAKLRRSAMTETK